MTEVKTRGTADEASRVFKATDPAWPIVLPCLDGSTAVNTGISKRELFAAMAMQGMAELYRSQAMAPKDTAVAAVDYADALIAELAKEPKT